MAGFVPSESLCLFESLGAILFYVLLKVGSPIPMLKLAHCHLFRSAVEQGYVRIRV